MVNEEFKNTFLVAAHIWVCDGYSLDARYMARVVDDAALLINASIALTPLPAAIDNTFQIQSGNFIAGQLRKPRLTKRELFTLIEEVLRGVIPVPGISLQARNNEKLHYYSDSFFREKWSSDLHIKISASNHPYVTQEELAQIDSSLRRCDPAFDGLSDLCGWLGLPALTNTVSGGSIDLRIGSPIDLSWQDSNLENDILKVSLNAHTGFDVSATNLAIRVVPGEGIKSRFQAAHLLAWKPVSEDICRGSAEISVKNAESVLTMITLGDVTVRRQWLLDPHKAANTRLLAFEQYDRNLQMLRGAVLDPDPKTFEKGIAALLFLLGFSAALQIQTDAPDIVVSAPSGTLLIVECTTRIADFRAKIGKLVDRRGELIKRLQQTGTYERLVAILVVGRPRDQIHATDEELQSHGIVLLSKEQISALLDRVRYTVDIEELINSFQKTQAKISFTNG